MALNRMFLDPSRGRLLLCCVAALMLGCGADDPAVVSSPAPDAAAAAIVCPPGGRQCVENTLWVCNADGTAKERIDCKAGCDKGECANLECLPNSRSCLQPKLAERCDADGNSLLTVCDHGCINGQCADIVCTSGLTFCESDGSKVLKCSLDGLSIEEVESCPYGCNGATALCMPPACQPGDTRCSPTHPDAIERCNDARTAFELTEIVCQEKCQEGTCYVSACQPGAKRCSAAGVEVCNGGGTAFLPSDSCSFGCLESDSGEAFCATCPPGAFACQDNNVVVCESPFAPWKLSKECKDIDTCVTGQCIGVLSLSGKADSGVVLLKLTEAIADCWLQREETQNDPQQKDKKKDVCRGLHTMGLDGDVDKETLTTWFCDIEGESLSPDDLSNPDYFAAAKDVYGCGLLALEDLTINTPGHVLHAGLSEMECIGWEKNELIIADCGFFQPPK